MKSNPYLELDLEALTRAFHARAGELLKEGVQRSPEERLALARDTAYQLLAAARLLDPGYYQAGEPEEAMKRGHESLVAAFSEWAERLQRHARHRVLLRAVNAAVPSNPYNWLREARLDDRHLSELATESEEGLARVLAHLQALVESGRGPKRGGR
jgi:hypothetical protein